MIRILLIRHGTTDPMSRMLCGRLPGIHLNDLGIREAKVLGHALRGRYSVSEIIASPLERALDTASAIEQATGAAVRIDEDLHELDYGAWTGMTFDTIRDLDSWQLYNRSRAMSAPPHGESMIAVQLRALSALERILERWHTSENVTVAVVTHGDVIRSLLVLFLGMPIDYIHRLSVSPCSVSEVAFENRYTTVVRTNQNFYE
jgi:probable phosphoglycerate mutase